jgi:hypothetical protein
MSKDVRAELSRLMKATLPDHAHWTYRAVRPLSVPVTWSKGQHVVADCSKAVQYLCRWAGAPDPMDSGWDKYGNSQTLWLRLQHLDHPSELEVGDIVTFGHNGEEHAAMVLETGDDPLLWSFGHQGAPNTYRLSQDHRPKQFLRNPIPHYAPTDPAKLRAKTGYFSWVAWKLGEGDWKKYSSANKNVRPNVPKRIPLSWWKRYAQFLLGRKKGNAKGTE